MQKENESKFSFFLLRVFDCLFFIAQTDAIESKAQVTR